MDLILKALNKAYELHKDQTRKSCNVPYFVHLLDTAKYLMYETNDAEIICAGILHDTLEDTDYSEDSLKNDFGERVYSLVKFCTEQGIFGVSEEQKKVTWKVRKTNTILKLKDASRDELLVFASDKISNLLSIKEDLINGVDVWKKFNGSKSDIEWYYSEIEKNLSYKIGDTRLFRIYQDLMLLFKIGRAHV